MSNNLTEDKNKKNKDLDQSQDNQSVVGDASDNPETSGPAENLREEAAKPTDNTSDWNNQHNLLFALSKYSNYSSNKKIFISNFKIIGIKKIKQYYILLYYNYHFIIILC